MLELHILQNFLWAMLFKMSSVRTVVTLQCRNTLQITSGNHYAVWQACAIHPHPSWIPETWPWANLEWCRWDSRTEKGHAFEISSLSNVWAAWCKPGELCKPKEQCDTSWILRQNFGYLLFKKIPFHAAFDISTSTSKQVIFQIAFLPHCPSVFYSPNLLAWCMVTNPLFFPPTL